MLHTKFSRFVMAASVAVFIPLAAFADTVADGHGSYDDEIAMIKADARYQRAQAYIRANRDRSNQDLIELTEIPAPPFGEVTRGKRLAEMLKDAGADEVSVDEVGNVIALRRGTEGKRVVAFGAHIDTVFPQETDVTVKVEGNRYIAPGVGDNTRGLVALLDILRMIEHGGFETRDHILFIGTVGEEGLGDLRGVKHLFRDGGPQIDSFIAIDGGGADRLVYGGVGSHRYRVTFHGPGGHSWGAFGLANPHHALGRAIAILDANAPAVTSEGNKSSYSVGRIGGGTSVNSIPFESWMEVDMRSGDQSRLDMVDAVFQAAMQQALAEENEGRADGPALTVEVKMVGRRPAGVGNLSDPLIMRHMAASKAHGIDAIPSISSTDANIPISMGIPAMTISRGGKSSRAHSLDEWWQDDDAHVAVEIAVLTVLSQAGVSN